jgi:glucose/arabinose dehydrogenase
MKRTLPWLLLPGVLAFACDDDPSRSGGNGPPPAYTYDLVEAFPNLDFARPTDIQHAGDGTNRLFVVEQLGRIRVFPNDPAAAAAGVFLDITGRVQAPLQSEMGLLGLAFHPQYETNGYFFVHYTAGTPAARLGRVSRFQVSFDPNVADPASEKILLDIPDRAGNHNGGALLFAADGYLYIALGDEGGAGDSYDNAQNRATLFGSILRLDVDQNVDVVPYYGIPPDNPFAGNTSGYREEIFAYGLRNPWRISYDALTDRIFAGDVGQGTWEEIDIITSGGNYGWDCREGLVAYNGNEHPPSPLCASATGFIDPILVYPRSEGQSVTGGYLYRGPTLSSLAGKYVYADYISGRIWALDVATAKNELLKDSAMYISTFGVAQDGELLVAGYFADGTPTALYRMVQNEVAP